MNWQNHVQAFAEGTPWSQLPIYVILAAVLELYRLLFVFVASEHGLEPEPVTNVAGMLSVVIVAIVFIPFVYGLANVMAVWYTGETA